MWVLFVLLEDYIIIYRIYIIFSDKVLVVGKL